VGDLLTGTITLLFSDLEGSTVLLTQLGPAYGEVLSGQRTVLRAAWAANDGLEMGTEGDSFFVVFATASSAVRAAVQAQRGLASRSWPGEAAVLVRMGIHTGSPTVQDGGYVGMDVHRAARIAAAAHGGQVVVSAATAELLAGALPPDLWLSDLGSHQLKDIPLPERILQVNGEGLAEAFPPLRTLTSTSEKQRIRLGLLDIPGTLIGRRDALAELVAMCADPSARLVTMLGPGGVGKTRLAQEVVAQAPGDASFVSLLAAERAEDVAATIATSLGIDVTGEAAEGALVTGLASYPRDLLLVLDNFEHVLPAAPLVERLLREAVGLTVLATSRAPLNVSAERRFPLEPLATVTPDGDPAPATLLLLDRIRRIDPRFQPAPQDLDDAAEVAALCDGLPLAIEIAAARTNVFALSELRARLAQPLSVLVRPGSHGQRASSVESSIEWSMAALPPDMARTLSVSTIFRGGFTAAALSAVAGVDEDVIRDHLHHLLEHSLIMALPTRGHRRFDLLQVVREVAARRLDESTWVTTAEAHVHYWRSVVGPQPDTRYYPDSYAELELISLERPNLRAAVRHAATMETSLMADLVVSLGRPWLSMGAFQELHDWIHDLLKRTDLSVGRRIDVSLHRLHIESSVERLERIAILDEAANLARESHDSRRMSMVLATNANFAWESDDDSERARELLDEAWAVAGALTPVDFRLEIALLETRAFIECDAANYDSAIEDFRTIAGITNEHGLERLGVATAVNLGFVLQSAGRFSEALEFTTMALAKISVDETEILAVVRTNHGQALLETGNLSDAIRSLATAVRTYFEHGSTRSALEALLSLAAARAGIDPADPAIGHALGVYQAGLRELGSPMTSIEQSMMKRHLSRHRDAPPDSELGRARDGGVRQVSLLGAAKAAEAAAEEILAPTLP
jgi:class 3 adenylate cyclase/predicted ATPase